VNPFFSTRAARATVLFSTACLVLGIGVACAGRKAVELPPVPLDDSSAAALRWVDERAMGIETDSTHITDARVVWAPIVRDVRILGVSELNEGTHEFPVMIRHLLLELARDFGYRGIAIQAAMAEGMDLDRYVRSGVGDPKRILRSLGPVHWQRQEMVDLLDTLRAFNSGKPAAQQVGFYGFESPTLRHAVQFIDSLSPPTVSAGLKTWLKSTLSCVYVGESANWGREGLASDTTFWTSCGVSAATVIDSLEAARKAAPNAAAAGELAFAAQMARLIRHGVMTGLRRLARQDVVAEHVLFVAGELGDGKLLVWGRDYEAGRIELDKTVIQMAVSLTKRIGQQYHALAFTFGEGTLRTHLVQPGREPGDERDVPVAPPLAGTYENVLKRARLDAFVLDMRSLGSDMGSKWLGGPHPFRVITGEYSPLLTNQLQHDMEFPRMYDGIVFVKRVTPARKMK
jgi:erythromycin esterase